MYIDLDTSGTTSMVPQLSSTHYVVSTAIKSYSHTSAVIRGISEPYPLHSPIVLLQPYQPQSPTEFYHPYVPNSPAASGFFSGSRSSTDLLLQRPSVLPSDTHYSPLSLSPLSLTTNLHRDAAPGPERPEPSVRIPRTRGAQVPRFAAALSILENLTAAKISATDLLLFVLSGDPEFKSFHHAFFSPKNHKSLWSLLTTILEDDKGSVILKDWMKLHAV
jgi:hypothetical protein